MTNLFRACVWGIDSIVSFDFDLAYDPPANRNQSSMSARYHLVCKSCGMHYWTTDNQPISYTQQLL